MEELLFAKRRWRFSEVILFISSSWIWSSFKYLLLQTDFQTPYIKDCPYISVLIFKVLNRFCSIIKFISPKSFSIPTEHRGNLKKKRIFFLPTVLPGRASGFRALKRLLYVRNQRSVESSWKRLSYKNNIFLTPARAQRRRGVGRGRN